MLNKSLLTLFVTIALAGFTAAFATISLDKHNPLRDRDGAFNHKKAMHSTSMTKSKYERNLLNFERNTRSVASSGEVRCILYNLNPLDRYLPQHTAHVSHSKIGSALLTDQSQGIEWTRLASVGDPGHSFIFHIDTASSDFWIPLSNCISSSCAKKNKYDPTKSSTSKAQPEHFSVTYAPNFTVQGAIYTDTVSVGGIRVTDQFLGCLSGLAGVRRVGRRRVSTTPLAST